MKSGRRAIREIIKSVAVDAAVRLCFDGTDIKHCCECHEDYATRYCKGEQSNAYLERNTLEMLEYHRPQSISGQNQALWHTLIAASTNTAKSFEHARKIDIIASHMKQLVAISIFLPPVSSIMELTSHLRMYEADTINIMQCTKSNSLQGFNANNILLLVNAKNKSRRTIQ